MHSMRKLPFTEWATKCLTCTQRERQIITAAHKYTTSCSEGTPGSHYGYSQVIGPLQRMSGNYAEHQKRLGLTKET